MYEALGAVDVDAAPVVVLACSHVVTIESLDGICGMSSVYGRDDPESGPWTVLKPLTGVELPRPKCPKCRVPITNVRRCGRVLNLVSLQTSQRKYISACQNMTVKISADVHALEKKFENGPLSRTLQAKLLRMSEEARKKSLDFDSENPYGRVHQIDSGLAPTAQHAPLQPSLQPLIALEKVRVTCLQLMIRCSLASLDQVDKIEHSLDLLRDAEAVLRSAAAHCQQSNSRKSFDDLCVSRCFLFLSFLDGIESFEKVHDLRADLCGRLEEATAAVAKMTDSETIAYIRSQAERWKKVTSGEPFYTKVTTEEKKAIFRAMSADVGSGVGSFGGHWFQCPDGHTYTIGECGGAMLESRCPECGKAVGGSHHTLNASNTVARGFLEEVGAHDQLPASDWRN